MGFRSPTSDEERLLRVLAANAGNVSIDTWIAGLRVRSMEDGGMGSLQFDVPNPPESRAGPTVTRLASVQFTDADGVVVVASLHAGADGVPFELDVWKTDFSRLLRIPSTFPRSFLEMLAPMETDPLTFTSLEKAVLAKLLTGDETALGCLRAQVGSARVTRREWTGVGFHTEIQPSDSTPAIDPPASFRLGDVVASIAGLAHGAGFVLFVKNGRLSLLEGYSFDEEWQPRFEIVSLAYVTEPRSLEGVPV